MKNKKKIRNTGKSYSTVNDSRRFRICFQDVYHIIRSIVLMYGSTERLFLLYDSCSQHKTLVSNPIYEIRLYYTIETTRAMEMRYKIIIIIITHLATDIVNGTVNVLQQRPGTTCKKKKKQNIARIKMEYKKSRIKKKKKRARKKSVNKFMLMKSRTTKKLYYNKYTTANTITRV